MKKILQSSAFRELLRVLIAVVVALTIGFIITVLVSDDPIQAYTAFLFGPLSKINRFGDWIEESITLIFLGLAVALVFKAELFSLGQEGQMVLGALVAGAIEVPPDQQGYGRVRLMHLENGSSAAIHPFIEVNIRPGSVLLTDDWRSYRRPASECGLEHHATNVSKSDRKAHHILPAVHRVFSLLHRVLQANGDPRACFFRSGNLVVY